MSLVWQVKNQSIGKIENGPIDRHHPWLKIQNNLNNIDCSNVSNDTFSNPSNLNPNSEVEQTQYFISLFTNKEASDCDMTGENHRETKYFFKKNNETHLNRTELYRLNRSNWEKLGKCVSQCTSYNIPNIVQSRQLLTFFSVVSMYHKLCFLVFDNHTNNNETEQLHSQSHNLFLSTFLFRRQNIPNQYI